MGGWICLEGVGGCNTTFAGKSSYCMVGCDGRWGCGVAILSTHGLIVPCPHGQGSIGTCADSSEIG